MIGCLFVACLAKITRKSNLFDRQPGRQKILTTDRNRRHCPFSSRPLLLDSFYRQKLHLFRDDYNVSYWDREPRLSLYFVLNNGFRRQEPLSLDAVVAATSGTGRCHDGCSRQRESDTWYTFTAKSGWDGSHRDACYTASERSSGVRRKQLHRDSDRYTAYGYGAKYIFPSKNCKSPTS